MMDLCHYEQLSTRRPWHLSPIESLFSGGLWDGPSGEGLGKRAFPAPAPTARRRSRQSAAERGIALEFDDSLIDGSQL